MQVTFLDKDFFPREQGVFVRKDDFLYVLHTFVLHIYGYTYARLILLKIFENDMENNLIFLVSMRFSFFFF